jgi:hypothetical protein
MERSKPNADFFQLCCMLLSMKMQTCINEKIKRRRSVLKKGRERRRHHFFLQMRRQLLVVLLMFLFAQKPISERSVWKQHRSTDVYEEVVNTWTDNDWKRHSRLSKENFISVKTQLNVHITKQDTVM